MYVIIADEVYINPSHLSFVFNTLLDHASFYSKSKIFPTSQHTPHQKNCTKDHVEEYSPHWRQWLYRLPYLVPPPLLQPPRHSHSPLPLQSLKTDPRFLLAPSIFQPNPRNSARYYRPRSLHLGYSNSSSIQAPGCSNPHRVAIFVSCCGE